MYDATAAYVSSSDVNVVMPVGPSSSRLILSTIPSTILSVAVTLDGLVTSSIWTPFPSWTATAAYMSSPDLNMAISLAPSSIALFPFRILPAFMIL